jgi:GTP-binding protein
MSIPLVAIVGRPNVGKSRLFNRLTRSRQAIVEDTPGVTRDRNYGEAEYDDRVYNLVDTGGFEPDATDELLLKMREQAQLAIDEADVVLLMFDGQTGLLAADHEITEMLRRSGKKTLFAVNKVDGPKHDHMTGEFYELGVSPLFPISAEHGRGCEELMDALTKDFPEKSDDEEPPDEELVKIAVFGRPNVGKSTLINHLIGKERLLTSNTPGTTRDAIDTEITHDGQRFLLIDTAGVRRRRSISLLLEKFSVVRAFKSLDRAEVGICLIDAVEGATDQDARLLNLAAEKGRAMVMLVNKWDLVEKDASTAGQYVKNLRESLGFVSWARIEFISALTGQRVHRVLKAALDARESWGTRIGTSELNRFLSATVRRNQPPVAKGRRIKFYYMTQVAIRPPTFLAVCNYPKSVPKNYRRYLVNQLREAYGFEGTPIRLVLRKRDRKE